MTTFSSILLAFALFDIFKAHPLGFLIFWGGVIWVVAAVGTVMWMASEARSKTTEAQLLWRHKGVRLFGLLLPLLFWAMYLGYCFFAHFVFDETGER